MEMIMLVHLLVRLNQTKTNLIHILEIKKVQVVGALLDWRVQLVMLAHGQRHPKEVTRPDHLMLV
jgi:hypothetical protein